MTEIPKTKKAAKKKPAAKKPKKVAKKKVTKWAEADPANVRKFSRTRLANYDKDELIQLMRDVRDNALEWFYGQVAMNNGKGTGAALNCYEQAVHHLEKLEGTTPGANAAAALGIPGFNPADVVMPPRPEVEA